MTYLWSLPCLVVFVGLWAIGCTNVGHGLERLSRRGLLVVAFIVWQSIVLVITEVLSRGNHLNSTNVRVAWLVVAAVVLAIYMKRVGVQGARARLSNLRTLPQTARTWPVEVWASVMIMTFVGALFAWLGWLYAPNNTDSLVYHLTRVAHWVQEGSVAHFATHWTGQVELAPLHEFNMLHLQLLVESDRLAGYVQLIAMIVAVAAVSEITRLLGGDRSTQAIAAVIALVIPSAILESTSTQNNIFGAAFGLAVVVMLLGWTARRQWVVPASLLGLAAGLAAIAKGNVLVVIGPLVLALVVQILRRAARLMGWKTVLRKTTLASVVALLAVLAMAGPFFARNLEIFGGAGGPVSAEQVNAQFSIRQSVGNVIRSVAVNFRMGDGDSDISTAVAEAVRAPLRWLYEQTEAQFDHLDFAITPVTDVFARGDFTTTSRFEEFGVNPWHVLLIVPALVTLVVTRRRQGTGQTLLVACCAVIGFLIFAATNRWSVYVPRYYLPLLFVWAAVIALAATRLGRAVRGGCALLLVVAVMPQLLDNWPRSVLHRRDVASSELEAYFVGRSRTEPTASLDFANVRDDIVRSGCEAVGITNWILIEYPLWAALEQVDWRGRIEHVDVENETRQLEATDFEPCVLVRQTGKEPFCPELRGTEVRFDSLSVFHLDGPFVRCAPAEE